MSSGPAPLLPFPPLAPSGQRPPLAAWPASWYTQGFPPSCTVSPNSPRFLLSDGVKKKGSKPRGALRTPTKTSYSSPGPTQGSPCSGAPLLQALTLTWSVCFLCGLCHVVPAWAPALRPTFLSELSPDHRPECFLPGYFADVCWGRGVDMEGRGGQRGGGGWFSAWIHSAKL